MSFKVFDPKDAVILTPFSQAELDQIPFLVKEISDKIKPVQITPEIAVRLGFECIDSIETKEVYGIIIGNNALVKTRLSKPFIIYQLKKEFCTDYSEIEEIMTEGN